MTNDTTAQIIVATVAIVLVIGFIIGYSVRAMQEEARARRRDRAFVAPVVAGCQHFYRWSFDKREYECDRCGEPMNPTLLNRLRG